MAQRKPRRRSGAKIATKKEQAELLKRARELADDPKPLVPSTPNGTHRAVDRLERRLTRISQSKDNPGRLKRFIKRGPDLARAYANLLLVAESDQAGRMASTITPVGTLKYAVRGMVPQHASVAVQHFRYPQVRIMGYRDIAQKTNTVIWAIPHGVALTARKDPPPRSWFDIVIEQANVELEPAEDDPGVLQCPHLRPGANYQDRSPLALELEIGAGPTRFQTCASCVETRLKDRQKSLLGNVAGLVIGLKPRQIHARLVGTPRVCVHEGECAWSRNVPSLPDSTLNTYREGRRSEKELMDRLLPLWEDEIRGTEERLLVAGDHCYGEDETGFLAAVGETGDRKEALERFLELGPRVLIAKEPTFNHVLEACWEVAPKVLKSLHPYEDELEGLLAKHARSPPAAVVDEVLEARRAHAVLKGFPRYSALPPAARAADRLARAYRTGQESAMAAAAEKELDRPDAHKGVLWAGLRIAGQQEAQRWRFDKISIEAGEFLEQSLRELLEAPASDYSEQLSQIHTLAAGQGALPKPVGTI